MKSIESFLVLVLFFVLASCISCKKAAKEESSNGTEETGTLIFGKILLAPILAGIGLKVLAFLPIVLSKIALLGVLSFVSSNLSLLISAIVGIRNFLSVGKRHDDDYDDPHAWDNDHRYKLAYYKDHHHRPSVYRHHMKDDHYLDHMHANPHDYRHGKHHGASGHDSYLLTDHREHHRPEERHVLRKEKEPDHRPVFYKDHDDVEENDAADYAPYTYEGEGGGDTAVETAPETKLKTRKVSLGGYRDAETRRKGRSKREP